MDDEKIHFRKGGLRNSWCNSLIEKVKSEGAAVLT